MHPDAGGERVAELFQLPYGCDPPLVMLRSQIACSGAIQKARVRLAGALLSIDDEDSRDVRFLKQAPLERMAQDYKRRS
jgi:hypothetical protein